MKKRALISLLLGLTLACSPVYAITGGSNTELPDVNAELPATLSVPRGVETIAVPFKSLENGTELQIQIMLPPAEARNGEAAPCIMMTRGSGLRAVELQALGQYQGQLEMFASQGYVVAGCEFRGYTTEPMTLGMFPAALQDCRAAVRFLKANAEAYGIDPDRIGIIGQSSGGYESSLLAVTNGAWGVEVADDSEGAPLGELYFTEEEMEEAIAAGKNVVKLDTSEGDLDENAKNFSSEVVCSIDLYGLAALDKIGADKPHTLTEGTSNEEVKFMTADEVTEIWDAPYVHTAANPYWYLDELDVERVAILFLHGTGDTRVPPLSTERFYELTQDMGIESYRFLIPDAAHGGPRFMQDDTSTLYMDFFDEHLKGEDGNRVTVIDSEGVTFHVTLNGEKVDAASYKLSNLSASDKITIEAVPASGHTFKGIQVVSIDDDYTVTVNDTDEMFYTFDGSKCASVTGLFD